MPMALQALVHPLRRTTCSSSRGANQHPTHQRHLSGLTLTYRMPSHTISSTVGAWLAPTDSITSGPMAGHRSSGSTTPPSAQA